MWTQSNVKSRQDKEDGNEPAEEDSPLLVRQKAESLPTASATTSCHQLHVALPTGSTPHLHVAVEFNGEAIVLHLNGFHAGLPHPRATGPIMENHFQILLLVLKQDIGTAASQLEVLPIKGHNVPSGAAHAYT
jgi:hypothetical protein